MTKSHLRAASILAAVALSIVGCDPEEPKSEGPPTPRETPHSLKGGPSPAPPVTPSPVPQLPESGNPDVKSDTKKDEMPK